MTRPAHWLALVIATLLSLFAASRIYGLMQADAALQDDDAEAVLRWRPDDPRGLLSRAEAQLSAGDVQGATITAKRVLQVSPAEGRAYRILGQAAQAQEQPDRARVLFKIAARRAPRDLPARAWLAQDALVRSDYADALVQIDAVLTMSPGAGRSTLPVLVKLAEDPDFASSLAQALRAKPAWRRSLMNALAAPASGSPIANDLVLAALQRNGGLDEAETAAWLDSLMRQGRWGEAYARWAGTRVARGDRLPLLFNGDFAGDPSGIGFDWKGASVPGVILGFEPAAGVDGRAAHLRFLGRRVSGSFLTHPLLLPPGHYRLQWRERAEALRGDPGIEWSVSCASSTSTLARSEPIAGTYAWRLRSLEVDIAPVGCSGQILQLVPTGMPGGGQIISGDIWIANVSITRT